MITITHIDTACIIIDINGYRIMTDPTLDEAGKLYNHGFGVFSRKTGQPALQNVDISNIDLVLLSHHQHKDNFDIEGQKFAATAPLIVSTKSAAKVVKNTIGLDNWESHSINTPKLSNLKITATTAQHRPSWIPEFVSGKVIGFIIEADELENGAIYISGDTVYFKGIKEVASRFNIDIAIFHLGSVQIRYLTAWAQYTMNAKGLLKAVQDIQPTYVIPIHFKGWTHFKQPERVLRLFILKNKILKPITLFLKPGEPTQIR
jgi:L-ascorbate metabolism protein UlaG (beta-lactamase superfamily)